MIPKVEGPWDIHYVDRLLAQLEAKAGPRAADPDPRVLETAQGVANLEEIACASPRIQGMSFGPADLAASRRMKTTRVGGGHPGYRTIADPDPDEPGRAARRATSRTRGTTRSRAWSTPARRSARCPSTAPTATSATRRAARRSSAPRSCSAASAPGRCTPAQIAIAKRVYSPDPEEVAFAKKVIEAIPDGRGVHMIDGKMQDDATWKQCKVMVNLAEMLARKDPELAEAYGLQPAAPEPAVHGAPGTGPYGCRLRIGFRAA